MKSKNFQKSQKKSQNWPKNPKLAKIRLFWQIWLFWQILAFLENFAFLINFVFFGKFCIFWNKLLYVISEAT
jgi:hypothetical protein